MIKDQQLSERERVEALKSKKGINGACFYYTTKNGTIKILPQSK